MILQALVQYYERMIEKGEVERPGWGPVDVTGALVLSADGSLLQVVSVQHEEMRGKKSVIRPTPMNVPTPVKRSSGVNPNFLCDNSAYFLGIDGKGKPDRAKQCFEAAKEYHLQLLANVNSPIATSICRFFAQWNPDDAETNPRLAELLPALLKGGNLIFEFDNRFAQEDELIRTVWQTRYDKIEDAVTAQCLVTGKIAPIATLHPSFKHIQGGQPSGVSLVSFNAPSFESYGRMNAQGLNAPVSNYAAFAYGAALNSLLADDTHRHQIGDTTIVSWTADGDTRSRDIMDLCAFGNSSNEDLPLLLQNLIQNAISGRTIDWNAVSINPDSHFFILGLSPNAARVSVRFFLRDTFRDFMAHLLAHYKRIDIVRPIYDRYETLWLWNLLNETVNQNARDKSPTPQLVGSTINAILTDTPYPNTLWNAVQLRIRADHQISRGRAAILKAYLMKNPVQTMNQQYKEVLTVELNEKSTYLPYVLGRLFSVLESIQLKANPGINATILDKYFSSACASPDKIFPLLQNLAQKHLKKIKSINVGAYIYWDKKLGELLGCMQTDFPPRLSLHDQGIFQLGYYHQKQKRYETKQEDAKNV